MKIRSTLLSAALAVSACPAAAHDKTVQHGVHTHGVADLAVAVDGSRLTVELTAPAHDVVGFEHEPASDADRAAVTRATAALRDHRLLFAMPAAARCRVAGIDVRAPWPAAGEHADFAARWAFDCEVPRELGFLQLDFSGALSAGVELNVVALTDRGQSSARIADARGRLALR